MSIGLANLKGRGDLFHLAAPDTPSNAAKQEIQMNSIFHSSPAYELSAQVQHTPLGSQLSFISFVSTANRPEAQVKFQACLTKPELQALRDCLDQALKNLP
jgi:hypothetical protein